MITSGSAVSDNLFSLLANIKLSSDSYIYIDGLVQDCSMSSTLAMEILLSCT